MSSKKKADISANQTTSLDIERAKLRGFLNIVKRASMFFTVSAVLFFAAAIVSFIVLLTSFSADSTLAIIGAVFTVFFLCVGLIINAYTKKESDFICKVKRRPLGYLMRTKISKSLIITEAFALISSLTGAAIALVMYLSSPSWTLVALAMILTLSIISALIAFFVSEESRKYIIDEIEFFNDLETSFAKRTHLI